MKKLYFYSAARIVAASALAMGIVFAASVAVSSCNKDKDSDNDEGGTYSVPDNTSPEVLQGYITNANASLCGIGKLTVTDNEWYMEKGPTGDAIKITETSTTQIDSIGKKYSYKQELSAMGQTVVGGAKYADATYYYWFDGETKYCKSSIGNMYYLFSTSDEYSLSTSSTYTASGGKIVYKSGENISEITLTTDMKYKSWKYTKKTNGTIISETTRTFTYGSANPTLYESESKYTTCN